MHLPRTALASVLGLSMFTAACATAPVVPRTAPVPPLAAADSRADSVRDERTLAAADRRPTVARPEFDGELADESFAPRSVVAHRTFTRVVEVPVEVERPAASESPEFGYVPDYDYEFDARRRYDRRRDWFPVHTLVGAGIGAVIGHQHGHRNRGAWIGAHTGLLFDLARWWR